MPLSSSAGDSFLRGLGAGFPQADVVIVHSPGSSEEARIPARVQPQSNAGLFDVTTPIYEGDIVEMDDPRGGLRRLHVTEIDIHDFRGSASFQGMSYIKASWSEKPSRNVQATQSSVVYNGPVVNVNASGGAQVAWGQSVTQHQGTSEISPGYEALAQALSSAVELLAANRDVDPEDLELGRATAEKALEEVVKTAPDRSALRSLLATLRGLVTVGANAAASEGARTLVASLVLP